MLVDVKAEVAGVDLEEADGLHHALGVVDGGDKLAEGGGAELGEGDAGASGFAEVFDFGFGGEEGAIAAGAHGLRDVGVFGGGGELGEEFGGDAPADGGGAVVEAAVGDGYDAALAVEDGVLGSGQEGDGLRCCLDL